MEGCIFCNIVSGNTGAATVLDDEHVVAFLDHRPLFPGHTLVVPREHHVTLSDLPAEKIPPFFERVQTVERAVRAALDSKGSFVAMNNTVSQSVPHLHVHVVPRNPKDGLRGFFWPRSRYEDPSHMEEIAIKIRGVID